jgi:hypothetical protein
VGILGYDGGGHVRRLIGAGGAVTDTYDYDAFGNEITHTGTTPNNYLYRGEQFDSDLGPRKTLGFETPASKLQASVASTG